LFSAAASWRAALLLLRSSTAAKVWLLIIPTVLVDDCSLTVFDPLRHILGQVVGGTQPLWDGLAANGLEPSIQHDCVLYRAPRRGARRLRGMFALRHCKRARLDTLASGSPERARSLLLTRKHTNLAGASLVGGIVPAATYGAKVRDLPSSGCVQAASRLRRPTADPVLGPHVRGRSLRAAVRHRRPAHGRSSPVVAPCASELARPSSCPHVPSPCCGPGCHYRHSGQLVLQAWPPSASASLSQALRVCR
jgi:hypothetical protein